MCMQRNIKAGMQGSWHEVKNKINRIEFSMIDKGLKNGQHRFQKPTRAFSKTLMGIFENRHVHF